MKMIPTKEVIEQYEKDVAAAMRLTDDQAQLNELNEIEQMADHYDWSNQVFIDEATGKKGLRGVDGRVLIPALYDEFPMVGSYRLFHKRPHVARLGDKYGIVAADGTGKPLTAFIYDSLEWDYLSPLLTLNLSGTAHALYDMMDLRSQKNDLNVFLPGPFAERWHFSAGMDRQLCRSTSQTKDGC
jgi:hypothetical protein